MRAKFIKRSLEPVIHKAVREFPATVLTGPRQSGKTTLLKHLFGKTYGYVSLEPPDVRASALADPRSFLHMHQPPIILDEVQYAPDLLPYIKESIDQNRSRPGQYILTGSQNLNLIGQVSESLAGRAAVLRLLPLSQREALGHPNTLLIWQLAAPRSRQAHELSYMQLWSSFIRGGYPELVANPKRTISMWHASYVQTYLERDVRSLRQIGDLSQFQSFIKALAARSGQLLNLTDISRDLGVAVNSTKAWLSILEATHQVVILRPYFANVGKRLVKTPKVYFTDVGTLCYLTGLREPEPAVSGPMGGAIFETAVVTEIFKSLVHQGREPSMYFWRTSAGQEVDIVVEDEGRLIPIEAKLSATPNPAMADGIKAFRRDLGSSAGPGYVIHPGDAHLTLASDVVALPFARL